MTNLPINMRLVDSNVPGSMIGVAPINGYTALQIPAYLRAMVFLSSNLASFGRTVRIKSAATGGIDTPHPLDELLSMQPNDNQDAFTFWCTLFFHLSHYSNGIAQIIRDPMTGSPLGLVNLLPEMTCPFCFDSGDGRGMQLYYDVGTATPLRSSDVIHLHGLSYDGVVGMNPIALQWRTLKKSSLIQAYATRFLERGGMISGAIEFPVDMSDEEIDPIVDRIKRFFTGANAEQNIMVIPGGGHLNNSAVAPQQSQFVEQAQLSVKEISMITGVPPAFLYENSEAKYVNTIEAAGTDVVRFTFRPIIEAAENQLSLKLLNRAERMAGLRININADALLRGDTNGYSAMVLAQVAGGVRTQNEGRALLGLAKIDDPSADKLKISGDTAPKPGAPPAKTDA